MQNKNTKFIVFEGGEGVGKSTQIELLCQTLTANNLSFIKTREPGGLLSAEEIRKIIFSNNYNTKNTTDLLLFTAARHENIANNILPNIGKVDFIICDRFVLSTLVYQGFVGGYDINLIKELHKIANFNLYPDLTIILDVDPQIALARLKNRLDINKYDAKTLDFHNKVAEGYRSYKNFYSAEVALINSSINNKSNFIFTEVDNLVINQTNINNSNFTKQALHTAIIQTLNQKFKNKQINLD